MAVKIAMIAITVTISISVKPAWRLSRMRRLIAHPIPML
jgi:hypothetical protein